MERIEISSGELLHASGDNVNSLEFLEKGSIRVSGASCGITINAGSLAGIIEMPGRPYMFDYDVTSDAVLISYPFETIDDICSVISSNADKCGTIAHAAVQSVLDAYECVRSLFEENDSLYQEMTTAYEGFPALCASAGEIFKPYTVFQTLIPPDEPSLQDWEYEYFRSLDGSFFLGANAAVSTGTVMFAAGYMRFLSQQLEILSDYKMHIEEETAEFRLELHRLKTRLADIRNSASEAKARFISENGASSAIKNTSIKNALDTVLSYSGCQKSTADEFKRLIGIFKSMPDKADTSDAARDIRRNISKYFYAIYEAAFIKSFKDKEIPPEIRMFLYFGFMDEELAGAENTASLKKLAEQYTPDPAGKVVTIYEWLKLICTMKVEPSKNEFDLDYPAYLREEKSSGNISADEMQKRLMDPLSRLHFEIANFFTLANRMTFGRVTSFVPVFCEDNVTKTLSESYLTAASVHSEIDALRTADFSCFYRETVYSDTSIGITREYIAKEVLPYIILMPNAGSRGAMWQEIEGSKRDTPARMMLPIFPSQEVSKSIICLAGEFRWEMCRREQGVHWNDVTDPSLTSEYCDYIQFYRKNHDLSPEAKEKLKAALQKARNSYKQVFIADYLCYIAYESKGSARLNKVARGLIFKYCPFPAAIRDPLGDTSPLYTEIVNRYRIKLGQKTHLLDNVIQKLKNNGTPIPEEITEQYNFLMK